MPVVASSSSFWRTLTSDVGALVGCEQRERVAVEGDDRRLQPLGLGDLAEPADDGAVALVHAVELADRHGRRAEARGHAGEALEGLHAAPPSAMPADDGAPAPSARTGRCVASHHMPSTGSTSGMYR